MTPTYVKADDWSLTPCPQRHDQNLETGPNCVE